MTWGYVATALVVGFVAGWDLASEAGRRVYNAKMDEIRAQLDKAREELTKLRG